MFMFYLKCSKRQARQDHLIVYYGPDHSSDVVTRGADSDGVTRGAEGGGHEVAMDKMKPKVYTRQLPSAPTAQGNIYTPAAAGNIYTIQEFNQSAEPHSRSASESPTVSDNTYQSLVDNPYQSLANHSTDHPYSQFKSQCNSNTQYRQLPNYDHLDEESTYSQIF